MTHELWVLWTDGIVCNEWKIASAIRVIRKVFSLHPVFGPPWPPIPLFQWYPQSKDILINLSMKCWYSAFNAQGSRLIIVVVQLGAVRIYVAAVKALRKKERQDETQFATKIDGFLSFIPRWMLMYFFAGLFWISQFNLRYAFLLSILFLQFWWEEFLARRVGLGLTSVSVWMPILAWCG
jgi:hypothetical protein